MADRRPSELRKPAMTLLGPEHGGDHFDAIARTATRAERERLWKIVTAVWPNYGDYVKRTTREIPVVVLERVGA